MVVVVVKIIVMGSSVGREIKKMSYIAMPMVMTTVSNNMLRVVSMMMIGHLGELSLSAAAIATSLANVTGFSLLFGMASALETLCGQANGAQQYQKLGIYTYGAVISLLLSLIYPMLFSSMAALFVHVPLSWALIFKLGLRSSGGALAIGLSYWFNAILLGIYVKYSSSCEKTHLFFSMDVFPSIPEFFRFGIPSAVMICLEGWSYELIILLSGLLPNPQLETSVLSICLTISTVHYFIPYSFGLVQALAFRMNWGLGIQKQLEWLLGLQPFLHLER